MKQFFAKKKIFFSGAELVLIVLLTVLPVGAASSFNLSRETLDRAEEQHGFVGRMRLLSWRNLIRDDRSRTDQEKLEKVNAFINRLKFVSDTDQWERKDYWATPVEFIAGGGGDCEDFSVAKYFTLVAMGVAEDKLSMTYVTALDLGRAHMVMTYHRLPGTEPLVLDNLRDEILPTSGRPDLLPVYSFNRNGWWVAKQRGQGRMVGRSETLERWHELVNRMKQESFIIFSNQ